MMAGKYCDNCLNSRPIISENGIHYICCLSSKKATDCKFGKKNFFVENPMWREVENNAVD